MNDIAAISRLARIAEALAAGCMPEPQDAAELTKGLSAYLRGDATIGEALGLKPGAGARLRWRLAERDRLIAAAVAFFPAGPAARQISRALSRYRSTAWPRFCHCDVCPHARGPEEIWWRVLKIRDRDLTERAVRGILNVASEVHRHGNFRQLNSVLPHDQ